MFNVELRLRFVVKFVVGAADVVMFPPLESFELIFSDEFVLIVVEDNVDDFVSFVIVVVVVEFEFEFDLSEDISKVKRRKLFLLFFRFELKRKPRRENLFED